MAPEAALETGVILRSGEDVGHQLAKNGAAPEKLHHAGGNGGAQESAAIKTADDAGGEFKLSGKSGANARGIFFRAAFGEGAAEEFAGTHGVEKAFAGERIDPSGGVAHHGPIFAEDGTLGESAFARRGQNVAVEARAFRGDFLFVDKGVQVRAEL